MENESLSTPEFQKDTAAISGLYRNVFGEFLKEQFGVEQDEEIPVGQLLELSQIEIDELISLFVEDQISLGAPFTFEELFTLISMVWSSVCYGEMDQTTQGSMITTSVPVAPKQIPRHDSSLEFPHRKKIYTADTKNKGFREEFMSDMNHLAVLMGRNNQSFEKNKSFPRIIANYIQKKEISFASETAFKNVVRILEEEWGIDSGVVSELFVQLHDCKETCKESHQNKHYTSDQLVAFAHSINARMSGEQGHWRSYTEKVAYAIAQTAHTIEETDSQKNTNNTFLQYGKTASNDTEGTPKGSYDIVSARKNQIQQHAFSQDHYGLNQLMKHEHIIISAKKKLMKRSLYQEKYESKIREKYLERLNQKVAHQEKKNNDYSLFAQDLDIPIPVLYLLLSRTTKDFVFFEALGYTSSMEQYRDNPLFEEWKYTLTRQQADSLQRFAGFFVHGKKGFEDFLEEYRSEAKRLPTVKRRLIYKRLFEKVYNENRMPYPAKQLQSRVYRLCNSYLTRLKLRKTTKKVEQMNSSDVEERISASVSDALLNEGKEFTHFGYSGEEVDEMHSTYSINQEGDIVVPYTLTKE